LTGSHSHGQGQRGRHSPSSSPSILGRLRSIRRSRSSTADTIQTALRLWELTARVQLAVGGSAIVKGDGQDHRQRAAMIAAPSARKPPRPMCEFKNGQFTVAGTDRSKSVPPRCALTAYVPHNFSAMRSWIPASTRAQFYDPKNFTSPVGRAHRR